MATDEENCVRAIAAALLQVSARLQGDTLSSDYGPQVTTEEAAEFVEMLDTIVANATSEERARLLLFDVNSDLVPAMVSMLQTPHIAVPHGGLARMIISSIRCLTRIATYHSSTSTMDLHGESALSYLATLGCTTIVANGGITGLTGLLGAAHTAEVHFAAGELLFSLLVRSEAARRAMIENDGIASLLSAMAQASSPQARCFVTACLRELANAHAGAVLDVPGALDVIIRSLALDDAADVRALCAEIIDVVFKNEPYAWRTFEGAKALCGALTTRLEKETSGDCLESCLKLLETLFVCDAALPDEATVQRPTSTFTEYFLSSFGDRLIISTMSASKRVSSLAARSLRLLLQLAPHYRYVGFNICQHFPSLSSLLRALVDVDNSTSEKADVTHQILRVELSMALAMILAQDPRARHLIRTQLANTPQWMSQLRVAVLGSLNAAALEYFTGVGITDVTGTLINDPRTVQWEQNGAKPLRSSIEQVFERQEQRWANEHQLPPTTVHISEVDASQAARMAFILLGYVVHITLTDVPIPRSSPPPAALPHGADPLSPDLASSRGVPKQRIGPFEVGTTRSAMLREWMAHPVKSAASRRAAADGVVAAVPRASFFFDVRPREAASPPKRHFDPAPNPTFSKFDHALKLCTRFAQFFNNVGEPLRVVYETDGNFARRQPKNASWYAAPTPTAKSWSIEQLKEGDLFYFSLPFVSLSAQALSQIRQRAVRHLRFIKNSFVITPQSARARRWFLFDMLNNIMPAIIDVLTLFTDLCVAHGDENVKFPVVMFRERDIAADGGSLHAGNLVEIYEQARFYFKSVAAKEGGATGSAAMGPTSHAERLTSQFLRDVESKIKSLSNAQFTGKEATFLNFDDDVSDDDDVDFVQNAEPRGTASRTARPYTMDSDDD